MVSYINYIKNIENFDAIYEEAKLYFEPLLNLEEEITLDLFDDKVGDPYVESSDYRFIIQTIQTAIFWRIRGLKNIKSFDEIDNLDRNLLYIQFSTDIIHYLHDFAYVEEDSTPDTKYDEEILNFYLENLLPDQLADEIVKRHGEILFKV